MESILDCNYLLLKAPLGRGQIQFHKDMESVLDLVGVLQGGV